MTEGEIKDPRAQLRIRAMDLLARREHSQRELQNKLAEHFPDQVALLPEVVESLQRDGLQSDSRFAEAFIAARSRKGQGPYRIRQELQQRGVSAELVSRVMAECEVDWFQLAAEVAARKYGAKPCDSIQERVRRSRFLQYRGFSGEQIQACFDGD